MGTLADKLNAARNETGTQTLAEKLRGSSSTLPVTPTSLISSLSKKYNSVGNTLGNFSEGLVKGALGTVTGLGEITSKGLSYLPGNVGKFFQGGVQEAELQKRTNLKAEGTAQKVGKSVEQIAEFFIPGGKVNQIEKILAGGAKSATLARLSPFLGSKAANVISRAASLGTKMGVRATEGGGIIAAQSGGDASQTKTGTLISGIIPVAGESLSLLAKKIGGIKEVGKRLAGALSGRGTAVIDEIIKDPKSALEGLTGESVNTLSKDARLLKETAVNMKVEAGKEYSRVLNNLQSIYENEGKSFNKGTEINKITDLLRNKFGIVKKGDILDGIKQKGDNAGTLDFESSRFIKPGEIGLINRALNTVKAFRDPLSPKTLESLASKIDKLKSQSPSAIDINSAIHTITSSLRDSVAKMGEEVGYTEGADLARNFATAMDKLDDFTGKFKATGEDLRPDVGAEVSKIGELRKGQPVILPETEKTKIIQDLSTLFSGNKDIDKDTLRKIVFGQELLSREAGRTLATATEKASTKIGDFVRELIISPILSPAAIGKITAKTTLKAKEVTQFILALRKFNPAARGSVIKLISQYNE